MTSKANAALESYNGKQPGSPEKDVQLLVVLDVVRGEGLATGKAFPTLLQLGSDCYGSVKSEAQRALQNLEEWKEVTVSTAFD